MKTFLTLALALSLGCVTALGIAGCDNKAPVAPPAKEAPKTEAPAADGPKVEAPKNDPKAEPAK